MFTARLPVVVIVKISQNAKWVAVYATALEAVQHPSYVLLRKLMAVYARSEDLVRIGAYKPGSDPDLDRALRAREAMRAFMTQEAHEMVHFADSVRRLAQLAGEV